MTFIPFYTLGTYHENFVFLSLFEVCQEWGVLYGGTWRTLKIPTGDLEHRVICDVIFNLRKISWKCCVHIFIESVSKRGPLLEYLEDIEGSWLQISMRGSLIIVIDDAILPQGRYPESFMFISLLKVFQEWEFLYGGTLRLLRVPDWMLGGQGHLLCHT